MMQYLFVSAIVACAVGYAVRRVRHTLQGNTPCCDCEGCELCNEMKKSDCNCKKHGCTKK